MTYPISQMFKCSFVRAPDEVAVRMAESVESITKTVTNSDQLQFLPLQLAVAQVSKTKEIATSHPSELATPPSDL
jgi:hypothetical protein